MAVLRRHVTDFFQVNGVGTDAAACSRTCGQAGVADDPFNNSGQWPFVDGSNFAVNPIDPDGIIISAGNNRGVGRLFRTTDRGLIWSIIGETPRRPARSPTRPVGPSLDGTYAQALAFGAPSPGSPDREQLHLRRDTGGRIFVTRTGQGGRG